MQAILNIFKKGSHRKYNQQLEILSILEEEVNVRILDCVGLKAEIELSKNKLLNAVHTKEPSSYWLDKLTKTAVSLGRSQMLFEDLIKLLNESMFIFEGNQELLNKLRQLHEKATTALKDINS